MDGAQQSAGHSNGGDVDKGAIASFSTAWFGLANGHDLLAQGLVQAFLVMERPNSVRP